MNIILNFFSNIFSPRINDSETQELEVEKRIGEIMQQGPIDNNISKDDFIRLVIRIYGNDSKYKPFVSYVARLFKYLIWISIFGLVIIGMYASIKSPIINYEDYYTKMHKLWIIYANLSYVLSVGYWLFNAYELLRKNLRHEMKKGRYFKSVAKPIWLFVLVPFTWFIGSAMGSIYNIMSASYIELLTKIGL